MSKREAIVSISDIDTAKVRKLCQEYNLENIDPDEIISSDCDILSPCALGSAINDETVGKLKCKVIAGGANNQLAEPRHSEIIKDMGILYVPDYVANVGGLMNVFVELEGYSSQRATEKTSQVYDNVMEVFTIAKEKGITTDKAADDLAQRRLQAIGDLRQYHRGRTARPFSTLKEITKRRKQ